jgi:hypothetical protein
MHEQQYLYACLDPECPVVTFIDRVNMTSHPEVGCCPGDDCKGPATYLEKRF